MRTIITPQSGSQQRDAPREGPLCYHNEPTVLRVLNGRNVYVCSRYPLHHCRACCPADVMLVEELPSPQDAAPSPIPFGSPLPCSPMDQSQAATPQQPESDADDDDAAMPSESPPSTSRLTTPCLPPAPSKSASHGSVTSRALGSGAVRSLTPIFNGFSPAAARANQLGGRFVTLGPQAFVVARMQRQMSGSQDSQGSPTNNTMNRRQSSAPITIPTTTADTITTNKTSRKRQRDSGTSTVSVRTAAQKKEHRPVWMRN